MRQWMAVWTLKRGVLDPWEKLDAESCQMASTAYASDKAADYSSRVSCTEPRRAEVVDPLDLDVIAAGVRMVHHEGDKWGTRWTV